MAELDVGDGLPVGTVGASLPAFVVVVVIVVDSPLLVPALVTVPMGADDDPGCNTLNNFEK